jgi:hypothetical protein
VTLAAPVTPLEIKGSVPFFHPGYAGNACGARNSGEAGNACGACDACDAFDTCDLVDGGNAPGASLVGRNREPAVCAITRCGEVEELKEYVPFNLFIYFFKNICQG